MYVTPKETCSDIFEATETKPSEYPPWNPIASLEGGPGRSGINRCDKINRARAGCMNQNGREGRRDVVPTRQPTEPADDAEFTQDQGSESKSSASA